MHYHQGGGKYPIHVSRGSFASRKEKLGEIISSGELAFMHLGALFRLNFSWVVLPMVLSPFVSP
jgi:hypothetical protein